MNFQEVCRTCLRSGRTMYSIFDSAVAVTAESEPIAINDLLKVFTGIQISSEDEFPNQICNDCLEEIHRSYSFKLKCQRSEAILHQLKDGQLEEENLLIELLDPTECSNNILKVEDTIVEDAKHKREPDAFVEAEDHDNNNETYESEDLSVTIIFRCPGCRYECIKLEILSKHIVDNHIENKFCKICSQEFKCDVIQHCSKHLPYCQDIRRASKKSRKKNNFLCEICPKIFACKSHLLRHKLNHTREKQFKCEICPKSFRNKQGLSYHSRTVHGIFESTNKKDLQCSICSKIFGHKYNLNIHMRVHANNESFGCKFCLKTFRYKNGLKYHMRAAHEIIKSTEIKDLQCSICSKICGDKYNLRVHMRLHTGDQPFQCKICLQTFRYKRDLKFHVGQNHADEDAVQNIYKEVLHCEVCSKIFTCKSSLVIHLRSHTKERPFKCEICSKAFRYKHKLTFHTKTKHKTIDCENHDENDVDTSTLN